MAKKTFHITGRVIDRESRRGVEGLRVEAWDKDLLVEHKNPGPLGQVRDNWLCHEIVII